ncbi:hypothetical protein AX16_001863 [Volvariella volvacea WC 439]|nr:hypothetical protein AX16_001863 [Volvariella volvacea WC 439]
MGTTLSSLPGCELVNPKLFLRSLRAPNLIHLKISNLRTDFGAALQDFVQNTPLLTSISLSKLDVTDVELIQILESLPNLQRMILGPSAHMISDLVIQRLKFRSEQELEMKQFPPNVCPKLQTLSMHLPTDLAPTLAAVLSSRSKLTQGCAKLLAAKLHLRLWQKSLGDHQGWFEELRADGVVVDVDFHEDRPEDD